MAPPCASCWTTTWNANILQDAYCTRQSDAVTRRDGVADDRSGRCSAAPRHRCRCDRHRNDRPRSRQCAGGRAGRRPDRGRADLAKLLAEATGPAPAAFGWFGGLKTEQGRIDLKKAGLFGIVGAVRALAICHHVIERSTVARLAGLKALEVGTDADLGALGEAHALFCSGVEAAAPPGRGGGACLVALATIRKRSEPRFRRASFPATGIDRCFSSVRRRTPYKARRRSCRCWYGAATGSSAAP